MWGSPSDPHQDSGVCRYAEPFPTQLPRRCRQLGRMLFVLCCELMNSQAEPGQPRALPHPQINKHSGRNGEAKPRAAPQPPRVCRFLLVVTGGPCALIPRAPLLPQLPLGHRQACKKPKSQAGMPHLKSIQALSPGQVEALNKYLWVSAANSGCRGCSGLYPQGTTDGSSLREAA